VLQNDWKVLAAIGDVVADPGHHRLVDLLLRSHVQLVRGTNIDLKIN
jgi:hypothetical protein